MPSPITYRSLSCYQCGKRTQLRFPSAQTSWMIPMHRKCIMAYLTRSRSVEAARKDVI